MRRLVERSRFQLWATALILSAVLAGTSSAAVYRVAPSGDDATKGTTATKAENPMFHGSPAVQTLERPFRGEMPGE